MLRLSTSLLPDTPTAPINRPSPDTPTAPINRPSPDTSTSGLGPRIGSLSSAWSSTTEYRANREQFNAVKIAEGYAARTTGLPGGQGITVAVIDRGFDVGHRDLPNLRAVSPFGESIRRENHGTAVAGIIAASRDGNGMHGIAYNAELVGIQGSLPTSPANANDRQFSLSSALLRSAASAEVGARIINLSAVFDEQPGGAN